MFSFLKRKKTIQAGSENTLQQQPITVPEGYLSPLSASELLNTARRQKLINYIWQRASVSKVQFNTLYLAPIERYAELVQQFPASEAHHHAYHGGMLDHGLEIIAYALKLRQSHLLPVGSSSEEQAKQTEVWSAGIAYAALLHDIGKIAVDLHVEQIDGSIWYPWHGPVTVPYRFQYRKEREYRLHNAATGLLYNKIIDAQVFDWLSEYKELWSSFLYVMAGQYEYAGILGELVTKADQASVAQELGGDPAKAMQAPKQSLQRKLLDGLRYIVTETLKLNQAQASDGWLTDDALWLVSKTVSDKLRAHLLSQGVTGIPEKNTAVFDVFREHGIAQPASSGKAIWSATVTSATGWSQHFTFLRVSPALIWNNNNRPDAFTGTVNIDSNTGEEITTNTVEINSDMNTDTPPALIPSNLDAIFNLLDIQEDNEKAEEMPHIQPIEIAPVTHSNITDKSLSIGPSVDNTGDHFMEWLRNSILSKKLIINDAQALVHTVVDTIYLVTPGIFMRYAQEYPQTQVFAKQKKLDDWEWVQKQFEYLKIHKRQGNGLNIWPSIVSGQRKTKKLNGYLLKDPKILIEQEFVNNPYIKVIEQKEDES